MYDSGVGSKIKSLTTPRQTFVSRRGGDQIGGCDQLRHAISLDRPRIAPPILLVVGRKIKGNGGGGEERRGEKSAAKRHRSLLYTPLRVFFARVCACEISSWSRSGCFHGESVLPSKEGQATKLNEEGKEGGDAREIPLATLTIVPSPLGGGERTRERERERKVKKGGKKGNGSS